MSSFFYLHNIKKIRKFLSADFTAMLIHAFISCRLDYCNSLYYGLPACQIVKLQRVQNAAAKLVYRQPRFAHVTPLLHDLHWLPVKFRIDFKVLSLTYKSIHGQAPQYLSDLIKIKEQSRYNLRSSSELRLALPATKFLSTLGSRSFTAAAPHLWNSLPIDIRNSPSHESFKAKLKTFLFRKAFVY